MTTTTKVETMTTIRCLTGICVSAATFSSLKFLMTGNSQMVLLPVTFHIARVISTKCSYSDFTLNYP